MFIKKSNNIATPLELEQISRIQYTIYTKISVNRYKRLIGTSCPIKRSRLYLVLRKFYIMNAGEKFTKGIVTKYSLLSRQIKSNLNQFGGITSDNLTYLIFII